MPRIRGAANESRWKRGGGLVRATFPSLFLVLSLPLCLSLFGRYPRTYDVRKTAERLASQGGGTERAGRKAAASESNGWDEIDEKKDKGCTKKRRKREKEPEKATGGRGGGWRGAGKRTRTGGLGKGERLIWIASLSAPQNLTVPRARNSTISVSAQEEGGRKEPTGDEEKTSRPRLGPISHES